MTGPSWAPSLAPTPAGRWRWTSGPVLAQLALLGYLEVVEWVPMFPWNDLGRGNGQEGLDIALGVVMAGLVVRTARGSRPAMAIGACLYALWFGLQVASFWIPYGRGASAGWARVWDLNFSRTVQWLPRRGLHLPPDANHLVLQLLLVVAIVVVARGAWAARSDDG